MSSPPAPFAVCFIGRSFPIPAADFTQAGPAQFVLDVVTKVTPQFWELKEVALFLTAPNILDASMALGLYIKAGNTDWQYRGCVHAAHPSEAMPLVWPDLPPGLTQGPPGSVLPRAGVSLEPAAELAAREGAKLGAREDFAKRVALNLFRYMESFGGASGDKIMVQTDVLDSWFKRFQEKFQKYPDFLARQEMPL